MFPIMVVGVDVWQEEPREQVICDIVVAERHVTVSMLVTMVVDVTGTETVECRGQLRSRRPSRCWSLSIGIA